MGMLDGLFEYHSVEKTGNSSLDKVLGLAIGGLGIGAATAVVVAGLANARWDLLKGGAYDTFKKGYTIGNILWQLLESKVAKLKGSKFANTIDQVLDLLGILADKDEVRQILGDRR